MMIDVALRQIDVGAKFLQRSLEAFRRGNRTERTHERAAQGVKRELFPAKNVLKIKRLMRAFDYLGCPIIAPDTSHQFEIGLAGVLRNENVAGATEITWSLAQSPTREQQFVPERRLPIYKHHIEPVFEMQILESVVEQQCVDLPFVDGQSAA